MRAVLIGDPKKIEGNIRKVFPGIKDASQKSMARIVIDLSSKIKFQKLSGQVLRNQTGHLRSSINPKVIGSGNNVVGEVSTNVEYAHIHEYGFSGTETVRAHLRRAANQHRALKSGKFGKSWAVKKSEGSIQVKSFTRHMEMPERSFMRTALVEMEPQIRETFENAIAEVISKLRGAA